MTLLGKVSQFNLEFEYAPTEKSIYNIIKPTHKSYEIIDQYDDYTLQDEDTFKYKLETTLKNYINTNINKLPFDTEALTYMIGFDYTAIPSRLEEIDYIESINIINMHIIYDNDLNQYVLDVDIRVWYSNKDGNIVKLLPVRPYTRYPVILYNQ